MDMGPGGFRKLFGQAPLVFLPFPFTLPFASAFTHGAHYSPGASCFFMPAAPFWSSAFQLVESALFLLAAWSLVRGRAAALRSFILASGIGAVSTLKMLLVMFSAGPVTVHSPSGAITLYQTLPASMRHEVLLAVLFSVLYPLIIGTCIALLAQGREAASRQHA